MHSGRDFCKLTERGCGTLLSPGPGGPGRCAPGVCSVKGIFHPDSLLSKILVPGRQAKLCPSNGLRSGAAHRRGICPVLHACACCWNPFCPPSSTGLAFSPLSDFVDPVSMESDTLITPLLRVLPVVPVLLPVPSSLLPLYCSCSSCSSRSSCSWTSFVMIRTMGDCGETDGISQKKKYQKT